MKKELVNENAYEVVNQLALIDIPAFLVIFSVASCFHVEGCRSVTIGLALINLLLGAILAIMKNAYDREKNGIEDCTLY